MGKPGPHLILFELCLNEVKTKANQVGNDQVVSVMRALSERSEDKSHFKLAKVSIGDEREIKCGSTVTEYIGHV
jgi:hypothetical protein